MGELGASPAAVEKLPEDPVPPLLSEQEYQPTPASIGRLPQEEIAPPVPYSPATSPLEAEPSRLLGAKVRDIPVVRGLPDAEDKSRIVRQNSQGTVRCQRCSAWNMINL